MEFLERFLQASVQLMDAFDGTWELDEGPGAGLACGSANVAAWPPASQQQARRLLQQQTPALPDMPPPNTGAYDTTSLAAQQQAAQDQLNQQLRRTLKLPPHVYLISFVLLVVIMSTLLMCHCVRMVRIAQRLRNGELQMGAGGLQEPPAAKRGTPAHIVQALPVVRFGERQQRAALAREAMEGRGETAAAHEAAEAAGSAPNAPAAGAALKRSDSVSAAGAVMEADASRRGALQNASDYSSASHGACTKATGDAASSTLPAPDAPLRSRDQRPSSDWQRDPNLQDRTQPAAAPAAAGPSNAPAAEQLGADGHGVAAAGDHDSGGAEACAICLLEFSEDDSVTLLPCSHIYHPKCIESWLARDVTCPLCKRAVADPEVLLAAQAEEVAGEQQPQQPPPQQEQGVGGGVPVQQRSLLRLAFENCLTPFNMPPSPRTRERREQRAAAAAARIMQRRETHEARQRERHQRRAAARVEAVSGSGAAPAHAGASAAGSLAIDMPAQGTGLPAGGMTAVDGAAAAASSSAGEQPGRPRQQAPAGGLRWPRWYSGSDMHVF